MVIELIGLITLSNDLSGRLKDRFVGGMSRRKNLFHYQNLCSQFRLMVNSYLTSLAVYVFFNIY